jgi:hypothetical protein
MFHSEVYLNDLVVCLGKPDVLVLSLPHCCANNETTLVVCICELSQNPAALRMRALKYYQNIKTRDR